MRKPLVLLLVGIVCLSVAFFTPLRKSVLELKERAESRFEKEEGEYEDEEEENEEHEREERQERLSGMSEWFWSRAYPDPVGLDQKFEEGWRQVAELRKQSANTRNRTTTGAWTSMGPNNSIGGRILTIAINPSDNQELWCGTASGGIWKSANGGTNWSSVTTGLPVLGVSSMIIHPTTTDIIMAGTGEVYRADSTTLSPNPGAFGNNVWKARGTYGIGVIRSDDGGLTWSRVLSRAESTLFAIQTLKFDNSNSSIVYACATDGLYRSTDIGVTWTKLYDITYVSDVEANGNNIVIAVGNTDNTLKGIWRSTDNGVTFNKIAAGSGFPTTFVGFTKMDCVPAAPNTIVASVGVGESSVNGGMCPGGTGCPAAELFRSTDFGVTWTALTGSAHTNWQHWSAHDVAINPGTPDRVIYGGVKWLRYTVSTSTRSSMTTGHDDLHDIQFDPTNSNIAYICCDGGIYKSIDGGVSFPTALNNGLGATQFYGTLGVSKSTATLWAGGLQDNNQYVFNGTSWNKLSGGGGDGASCGIDPFDDTKMILGRDAHALFYSADKGVSSSGSLAGWWGYTADSRTAFVAPTTYAKPLSTSTTLYYMATDMFHVSTNYGVVTNGGTGAAPLGPYIDAKNKTGIALAVSATNVSKIYVSTSNFAQKDNDINGFILTGTPNFLKSTNGGTSFTSFMGTAPNNLPNRFITDIAVSPTFDDSVFVTVGGFGTSHVYVTGNGGTSWTARSSGLPDMPFMAIVFDPNNRNTIYAGGDAGVWVSPNRGANWYDYSTGFWDATQVMDLQITADKQIVAATHGKGVFRSPLYTGSLPVTIRSFTGEAQGSSNFLQWKVEEESNLSTYIVERSTDGVNFNSIGMVPAIGNSKYSYTDAFGSAGDYYYRLKVVEKNNSYQYSNIVVIRRNGTSGLAVLGNPFTSSIDLRITTSAGKAQFNLFDAAGKLLRTQRSDLVNGVNPYTINNLSALPSGTYVLEATINGKTWKERVVKK